MSMRRKLLTLVAVLCVGIVIAWRFTAADRPAPDAPPLAGAMAEFKLRTPPVPTPEVGFTNAQDDRLDFSAFKGKLTLVNLWATWCAPCVREMPSLEALKQARGGDRFAVVTISEDLQGAAPVEAFFEKNGITNLPAYLDPKNAIGRALKINGLPTTLLFDPAGRELGRFEGGADWSSPEALALIDWYLASARP
jgi:thiol-disulfide isomerase/thioredoxin